MNIHELFESRSQSAIFRDDATVGNEEWKLSTAAGAAPFVALTWGQKYWFSFLGSVAEFFHLLLRFCWIYLYVYIYILHYITVYSFTRFYMILLDVSITVAWVGSFFVSLPGWVTRHRPKDLRIDSFVQMLLKETEPEVEEATKTAAPVQKSEIGP
jgi:hypothetical protein